MIFGPRLRREGDRSMAICGYVIMVAVVLASTAAFLGRRPDIHDEVD
jgi:hypothetical protein